MCYEVDPEMKMQTGFTNFEDYPGPALLLEYS